MAYTPGISKIIADGSRAYSAKDYDLASEKYAEACELFSEENSEEDADLLLLYGKALFQSAVSKSDVFGGSSEAKQEEKEEKEDQEKEEEDDGKFQFYDAPPLEGEEVDSDPQPELEGEEQEEEGEGEQHENGEEEQSDFEVAWEILDLTRTLFESQADSKKDLLQDIEEPYFKDSEETTNEYVTLVKKLSETYDLLGEVSLEAGNFAQAVEDFESCLNLRLKLYDPKKSTLISESHYKLSLALEFSVDDPELRNKAVEQMKLAIESVVLRNKTEDDESKIKENDELIQDLKLRLQDLEKDPAEEIQQEQLDIIKGLLGEPTSDGQSGSSSTAAAAINDLTSIVKKKVPVNDLTGVIKKRKTPGKPAGPVKKAKK
ncbi:uncharacterized protein CANTADRAFT_180419 [Suhomyces tanzawaensis NRRL Y-17324]|uniref:Tetratricopeptide SHNi-TPR domain-containing protein n=1 Tax=Suhomyces tanzawaensis NRRL Y-17324 TaxID=984487 RepID=A0A1E4SN10_9ASCO|nr:uncharacterized protein CANTADRAFT_180419 [Suhomyces tanzawaensis NRRL Y-17324]ODV80903.1 hypothetical protein CANTADRAFT_180419 [Suhomyces tanzawaensis NRRL Y-17324]